MTISYDKLGKRPNRRHEVARKARQDARTAGSKVYLSGRPCKYGHTSERYVQSGVCRECMHKHNRLQPQGKLMSRRIRVLKSRGIQTPTRPMPETCECCGGNAPGSSNHNFCVDHNHETMKFRGWLCGSCNRAIGLLGDNFEGVYRAMAYMANYHPDTHV